MIYCCSVAKLCLTPCNPMDCSMPGLPDLHCLLEFAQVHVHWIGNAIQSSHSLPHSSPFAFYLSQHQGLFKWYGSSHQVAKVLELQLQHQSLPSVFRFDLLNYWLVWSPCCPRDYISIPQLIYCYCNTYLVFFHFWLKDVYEWNCYKSSPLNLDRMPKYFQMIFPTWMLTSMYKSAHSSTSFQQ